MNRLLFSLPVLCAGALLAACSKTQAPAEDGTLYPLTLSLSEALPSRSNQSGDAVSITEAQNMRVTVKRAGTQIIEYENTEIWTSTSKTLSLTAGSKDITVRALFGFTPDETVGSTVYLTYSGSVNSVSVPVQESVSISIAPENSRIKIGSIRVDNSERRMATGDCFEICGIYVQDFSAEYPGVPKLFSREWNDFGHQGTTAHYGTVSWTGNKPQSEYELRVLGYDDVLDGSLENPYFYINVHDASCYTDEEGGETWTRSLRSETDFDPDVDPVTLGGSRSFNQYFFVPSGADAAKLVIWVKTQKNGRQDFYYHIPLPTLQPGKSYEVATATLTRYGSTDPATPMELAEQNFTIRIVNYDRIPVTDGTTL